MDEQRLDAVIAPSMSPAWPPDLVNGDMIFFSDAQVKTMQTGAVNSAQDRITAVYDKIKAKAAG